MSTTATTDPKQTKDTADILAHEQKELERIEALKLSQVQEKQQRAEKYKGELQNAEADERAKSVAELRSFEEKELPKMLEKGEQEIVQEIQKINIAAEKMEKDIIESLVSSVVAGAIAA